MFIMSVWSPADRLSNEMNGKFAFSRVPRIYLLERVVTL